MFGSRSGMMAERVLPSVFGGGELRDLDVCLFLQF